MIPASIAIFCEQLAAVLMNYLLHDGIEITRYYQRFPSNLHTVVVDNLGITIIPDESHLSPAVFFLTGLQHPTFRIHRAFSFANSTRTTFCGPRVFNLWCLGEASS